MRRTLAALLAVILSSCAGSRPRATPEPRFDPARARSDVAWLADPAREGRGVGTAGGDAAARWIAERMRALGAEPGFPDGYLQPFDAPFRASLRDGNRLELGSARPGLGDGWQPLGFSDDGDVEGELVWAGYGITAPEHGYDDYAGLDVAGKVVLVAADFPRESDPASPFREPRSFRYGEWRYKATNAREHGAAAVIGVRDDWNHPGDDALAPWRGQVSSRAGIVAARTTLATLAAGGVDAAALARPGADDGRPHSRALGVPVRLSVRIAHERARTANVVGVLPGRDPAVAAECVVVGAHHDHLGHGNDASLAPDRLGEVHPGADDNASGVAALLAIGEALRAAGPARRTVVLAAFGAEELGLLGSAELVRAPPPPCEVERMQLMVNLDMVGRAERGKLYLDGAATAKGLREAVTALAATRPRVPLELAFGGDGYGPSDHTSFYAKGVPVLFFFTGAHLDYHRPSDTAEKIDAARLVDVARLAFRAARDAAERPERLEVVRAAPPEGSRGRERGYGAYLGTIPDFAERSAPGVLLTGVRPASPAEKAGIRDGDVVHRVGRTSILSLADLGFALRAHRPGDVVDVEIERDGARRVVKVTLEERR
jgi:hypothetical protein